MGKSKSAGKVDAKVAKPTKEAQTKIKDVAKHVGGKADKKSKKAKKEPTPEPSSESSASSDEEMSSVSSASSDHKSELETVKPLGKANGVGVNGAAKGAAKAKKEESSDSESSSSSDDEAEAAEPKAAPAKVVAAKGDSSDDSGSEEDSEESDDDDAAPGAVDSKELKGKLEKVASNQVSSDEDSNDESGSVASSSDESEDSESDKKKQAPAAAPQKRKAEADVEAVAKKAKTHATEGEGEVTGNLFVGNLSWNVDEEWLVSEFGKFGELAGARIISDRETGRSKGFGYVDFVKVEDSTKAVEGMNGTELDGRPLNVNPANARPKPADRSQQRQKSFGDATSPPSETLFVANIAFGTTEDTIGEAFGEHGTVTNVRLPTDKDSGQPKGFGYVQFAAVNDAIAAYEAMKGFVIEGRPVRLDYAAPKPDRDAGGFGGGRGGGRGRGGDRGRGRGRGGFDRGGRGGGRGGRGGTTNRGGFGDFQGKKKTFEG